MSKKKHNVYLCRDCEVDFIVRAYRYFNIHNPFCPKCGEKMYVEVVKGIWSTRPYIHNTRYTQEEDDVIIESRRRGIMVKDIKLENRTTKSIERRWYRLRQKGVSL